MMSRSTGISLVCLLAIIAISTNVPGTHRSSAQTTQRGPQTGLPVGQRKATEAEVLVEKELENLLRSRARLGAKHPSAATLDQQISALRSKLNTMAISQPASNAEPSPFTNPRIERRPTTRVRNTTDQELRELVEMLTQRVEALEKKVKKLEARP